MPVAKAILSVFLPIPLLFIACSDKSEPPAKVGEQFLWYFEKAVKIVEDNAGNCEAIDRLSADFFVSHKRELQTIRDWSKRQNETQRAAWGLENLTTALELIGRLGSAAGECNVDPIQFMFSSSKKNAFNGHQATEPSHLFPPLTPDLPSPIFPEERLETTPPTVPTSPVVPGATGLVKILSVTTLFSQTGRVKMSISIDLETLGAMPPMPPHLEVVTTCDGRISQDNAFFMSLDDSPVGAVKQDNVAPFFAQRIEQFKQCEYRLQLSNALKPTYFCYRDQVTIAGRCSQLQQPPSPTEQQPAEKQPAEKQPAEKQPVRPNAPQQSLKQQQPA